MKWILIHQLFFVVLFSENLVPAKEVVKNSRMFDIPKIANDLFQEANSFAKKGDFESASEYYTKSLELKKEIGLEKTASYSEVLKQKAISEHKLKRSCESVKLIKEANLINEFLAISNQTNFSLQKEFESNCKPKLSSN